MSISPVKEEVPSLSTDIQHAIYLLETWIKTFALQYKETDENK
jgi:hypothetical protein